MKEWKEKLIHGRRVGEENKIKIEEWVLNCTEEQVEANIGEKNIDQWLDEWSKS